MHESTNRNTNSNRLLHTNDVKPTPVRSMF
jgi:hypothetical protein